MSKDGRRPGPKKIEEMQRAYIDSCASRDCEHGQLARSCNICEMEREIATLKAENERIREENAENLASLDAGAVQVSVLIAERDRAAADVKRLEGAIREYRRDAEGLRAEVYRNAVIMKADLEEAEGARDRLKADVYELANNRAKHIEEKFVIRAERDRYREALENLVALAQPSGPLWYGCEEMVDAREALGGLSNSESSSQDRIREDQ